MAQTETQIANLALLAAGTRSTIAGLTEASREAEICNLFYGQTRDQLLKAAPWSFSKSYARLAVTVERDEGVAWVDGDPEPGYHWAYALPSLFLYPRYMHDFSTFTLGAITVGASPNVKVIMSNLEAAVLTYTKLVSDPAKWDEDFTQAMIDALSGRIAMPLHGKSNRAKLAIDSANQAILNARLAASNEESVHFESMPDWFTARGVSGPTNPNRYIYPVGPTLAYVNV